MPKIVTANRLGDGQVVFLTGTAAWSARLADAAVADDDAFAAELLAAGEQAERDCAVVGPYLIEVTGRGDTLRAVAIRESIRANGPTVAYGPR